MPSVSDRNKVFTEPQKCWLMASLCLGQFQNAIPQYLLEEQFSYSFLGWQPDYSFPEVRKMSIISWCFPAKGLLQYIPTKQKHDCLQTQEKVLLADDKRATLEGGNKVLTDVSLQPSWGYCHALMIHMQSVSWKAYKAVHNLWFPSSSSSRAASHSCSLWGCVSERKESCPGKVNRGKYSGKELKACISLVFRDCLFVFHALALSKLKQRKQKKSEVVS